MNESPDGGHYLGIYGKASVSQRRFKKYLMIALEVVRRRRVIETLYGALCFIIRRPSQVEGDLRIEMGRLLPYLLNVDTAAIKDLQGRIFPTRAMSVYERNDTLVAGEYAFRGARIYVKKGKLERYY